MLNKDRTPRDFKHIDPENLPMAEGPPYDGSNAECLADGLLDVIQISMQSGMSHQDVDDAMKIVANALADQERLRFRLHVRDAGAGTKGD